MKNIILFIITLIITFYLGMRVERSFDLTENWDKGFDSGVAYAVDKYVQGKLLKSPEEPLPSNFVDCWFVTVIEQSAPIALKDKGGTLVSGCTFAVEPLTSDVVKQDAYELFNRLNKEQQK